MKARISPPTYLQRNSYPPKDYFLLEQKSRALSRTPTFVNRKISTGFFPSANIGRRGGGGGNGNTVNFSEIRVVFSFSSSSSFFCGWMEGGGNQHEILPS